MVTSRVTDATAGLVSACGAAEVEVLLVGDASVVSSGIQDELDRLDGGGCGSAPGAQPQPGSSTPPQPGTPAGGSPATAGAPPAGEYRCHHFSTSGGMTNVRYTDTIRLDGVNAYDSDLYGSGTYTFDGATELVTWQLGELADFPPAVYDPTEDEGVLIPRLGVEIVGPDGFQYTVICSDRRAADAD